MTGAPLLLAGGSVALPDGSLDLLDVEIAAGRITALAPPGASTATGCDIVDATGMIVAPGFIDLQLNGGWGHDFTVDPASMREVGAMLPRTGVTAYVPTIVTSARAQRDAALAAFAALAPSPTDAVALGVHFEGPAISPARAGAHDRRHIGLPDPAESAGWSRSAGVAMVTLAPEIDGAIALTSGLTERGVVVAIGHTGCTAEQFAAARRAGARMVTHLFNAMAPFGHREPGPIGATLADDSVAAGLICDGIHVDPVAVRAAWHSLGPTRTVLVTDAIAALGVDAPEAQLGTRRVVVDERGVRTRDGVLAGSNLALDDAVRNLVRFTGCRPADALSAATSAPAAALGLHDRGRIAVGARADVVLLDADLVVRRTLVRGQTAWKS